MLRTVLYRHSVIGRHLKSFLKRQSEAQFRVVIVRGAKSDIAGLVHGSRGCLLLRHRSQFTWKLSMRGGQQAVHPGGAGIYGAIFYA